MFESQEGFSFEQANEWVAWCELNERQWDEMVEAANKELLQL